MRRLALVLVASLVVACAGGQRPSLETLADAAATVEKGGGDARELALAGWHAWIAKGDAEALESLAARALKQDAGDPWAHLALAEAARRRLDPAAEAEALLTLIERAPGHPLATVAAGRLPALSRFSADLDRTIADRAARGLPRAAPETAARLRSAIRFAKSGEGVEATRAVVADAGLITAAAVVGPFSPWHALDVPTAFPPELDRAVAPSYLGPQGEALALRPFELPSGWISLRSEEGRGDVYYALSVAEAKAGGRHVVRLTVSDATSASVFVDGVEVVSRKSFGVREPSLVAAPIELPAGRHLVAVKVVRGRGNGDALVSIAPADGSAAKIAWRAAKPGDVPGSKPELLDREEDGVKHLAGLLGEEAGVAGLYAAARDGAGRDPDGARRVLDAALSHASAAAPLLELRAELARGDDSIPSRLAQGRAAADLEKVLEADPKNPAALVASATLLSGAGRHEEALERLETAQASSPRSALVSLARADVALARGFDVQALQIARAARSATPDACQVGRLLHDLARRNDAAGELDATAQGYVGCAGGRARLASHLADRGDFEGALAAAVALRAEDPQDLGANLRIADLLLARGAPTEAAAVIGSLEAFWPRNAYLPRRRAELLERAGDRAGARAARDRALSLDGSDLSLRRLRALEDGSDVLAQVDRDGLEVIREFEANPRSFDTQAVLLFDFAAVEAYADGSYVERTHTIAKVLDKGGIDEFGEVNLPSGAQVIRLRTIKQDGRILEPEAIDGKESISLPGLEVGDYVEYEYLVPHDKRGPALPGWSGSPFFFRIAGVPLLDSVYVIRAEKGAGLEIDSHNGMEVADVVERDGWITTVLRRTDSPAFIPEPSAPGRQETLPWVQVGAGADEERIGAYFADNLAGSTDRSYELSRWARKIAAKASDRKAVVRALYDAVMEQIEGADGSFHEPAGHVLAKGRGNRLLVLKAALDELGIESRFAAVRRFSEDPTPWRFPSPQRWGYLVLAVRPDPDGPLLWLDPATRWAPFGVLEPQARDAAALLLPEPGKTEAIRTSTPKMADAPQGREVEVKLALDGDGTLSGTGTERYLGFEAAFARAALEGMNAERRRQAVEASLAKSFRGLTLEDLQVHTEGGTVAIEYRFRAPGYARAIGGERLQVDLDFFAASLGKRYVTRATRTTPLLLRNTERVRTSIELSLPKGVKVVSSPEAAREKSAYGDYRRAVASADGKLAIQEELSMERGRIAPAEYPAFASWASGVDRAQAIELVLER